MSQKTRDAIGWLAIGALAITGIIYCTWGSPYGTTRLLRFGFIMLAIYGVTYNIALNVPLRRTFVRYIPIGLILIGFILWRIIEEGRVTIPYITVVFGVLAIVCAIGGIATYFLFQWLERYSYGLDGSQQKEESS